MPLSIDQVTADNDFIIFRHKCLRQGKPIDKAIFTEDGFITSYHFSAKKNGNIVGVVSYFDKQHQHFSEVTKSYQLRGMAVDADFRNQGIGKSLLATSTDQLKHDGVKLMWCNARQESMKFYEKNDFIATGSYFNIPDVGSHILMHKYLHNE